MEERDLFSTSLNHSVQSHTDKLRGDSSSAMLLFDCKHGDVASEWAAAVRFELGDYDAEKAVFVVQGLSKPLEV